MLLGILQCDGSWVIKSNQESRLGCCDILLLVPGGKIGCAIELKYAENGSFDAACEEALAQIAAQNYTDYLQQEGMETIYTYAVACYKKSCKVVCRTQCGTPCASLNLFRILTYFSERTIRERYTLLQFILINVQDHCSLLFPTTLLPLSAVFSHMFV